MENRQQLKDHVYMAMALRLSELGTCCRLKVGCILLRKDGSIASGGYNGSLPGMIHCNQDTCNSKQRCLHTSHAEENAIFFSNGNIHTAYITHEPCLNCTRMMARRGLKRLVYLNPYLSTNEQEMDERHQIYTHYGIERIRSEFSYTGVL